MKRVLIVAPSFPPVSAADGHRVRTSLPYYREFGWSASVLAIRPAAHGGLVEPELVRTIPAETSVTWTGALPAWLTRAFGIGDAGLRAYGHLYAAGARVIRRDAIDLVCFSTTMFPVMTLGRIWKTRFGTPYVLDMQDPWRTEYRGPARRTNVKARLARAMHARLEPFAMRRADGVLAVSPAYIDTLRRRYPWLPDDSAATVTFGASDVDADAARSLPWQNPFFDRDDGMVHGVAVGRGGADMATAARALFHALAVDRAHRVGPPVTVSFVGTDYAARDPKPSLSPLADEADVADLVRESPARIGYLPALRLLQDAHFTVILGSDDKQYSPSKVFSYLLAGRPFVAILHEASPAVALLRQAGSGLVVTFGDGSGAEQTGAELAARLSPWLRTLPTQAAPPPSLLAAISAREMTRRQCRVFDAAARHATAEGVPCPE